MSYDCVFFTPETKAKALPLYRRIGAEETARRRITPGTATVREQVPIPNEDGSPSGKIGTLFVVADYGTDEIVTSLVDRPEGQGRKNAAEVLMLETIEPGLVVGNFKPGLWETEPFKSRAEQCRKLEAERLAAQDATVQAEDEGREAAQSEAIQRYYTHVAHLAGVRKPERLSLMALADICRGVALAGEIEICSRDEWLASFPELEAKERPPMEEIRDPQMAAAQMLAAAGKMGIVAPQINRTVKKRG